MCYNTLSSYSRANIRVAFTRCFLFGRFTISISSQSHRKFWILYSCKIANKTIDDRRKQDLFFFFSNRRKKKRMRKYIRWWTNRMTSTSKRKRTNKIDNKIIKQNSMEVVESSNNLHFENAIKKSLFFLLFSTLDFECDQAKRIF